MTIERMDTSSSGRSTDIIGDTSQFLTFTVENAEYGVDIMTVREIKGWSETTRLPNTPEFMRGVINLRGIIVPIFDLRTRFSMGITQANPKNVVIILAVGDRTIGILVDTVSDILTVGTDEIKASPAVETTIDDDFVDGLISVEERMVILLKVDHLFDSNLLEQADQHTHKQTQH